MTNILNYVLGGLLVLAVVTSGTLWFKNNSLEKQVLENNATITTLSVQKDALQTNNNELKDVLNKQNTSILALGDVQKEVKALFITFNSSLATTNKQISNIKDAVTKEKPPATCQDTIKYLKDARKEYK